MKKHNNKSYESCMKNYCDEGTKNAFSINNSGKIKFDKHGNLNKDIVHAYNKYGFISLRMS